MTFQEGRCGIYSFELDREVTAYFDQILPVKPQQGDRVRYFSSTNSLEIIIILLIPAKG